MAFDLFKPTLCEECFRRRVDSTVQRMRRFDKVCFKILIAKSVETLPQTSGGAGGIKLSTGVGANADSSSTRRRQSLRSRGAKHVTVTLSSTDTVALLRMKIYQESAIDFPPNHQVSCSSSCAS